MFWKKRKDVQQETTPSCSHSYSRLVVVIALLVALGHLPYWTCPTASVELLLYLSFITHVVALRDVPLSLELVIIP